SQPAVTQTIGGLSIDTASLSSVDISDNILNINYTGASPLPTILGYVKTGYNSGTWTGAGITNSTAAADTHHGIGYSDRGSAITLKYLLYGDANQDATVNFADLLALAQNYNATGQTWSTGDFNYDGTVNFTDLLAMAQNYNLPLTGSQSSE